MNSFSIALIGCGTVGSGVAKLLLEQKEHVARRAGRPVELRHVVVRDVDKHRDVNLPRQILTTNLSRVLEDPDVDAAVEVVGGADWAKGAILDLLKAGKHIVTANKALLANSASEIFAAAREHGKAIAFEASVAGGVPIVAALTQSLSANQITAVLGILNGTSNFILTGMSESGRSYQDALADAQRRGYAEADPTMDVDGTDAAQKLAILAQIAFGANVKVDNIPRIGITQVQQTDIRYAQELGYRIKLLAEAWLEKGELALHVTPVLLRNREPLAQVRGPYNAIEVIGDAVGDTLYYGRGAGQMPTASAVVADIIDLAVGRAQLTFATLQLWSSKNASVRLRAPAAVPSRFCLRVMVEDRPGILAEVAQILGRHEISISSVIQHEQLEEHKNAVPLIFMTHSTPTGVFQQAVRDIELKPFVMGPSVYYFVAD